METINFSITAAERETGLSKDVLRIWERRYGFPTPERDSNGERAYSSAQVDRLRLIKRLMDQGHRPGKLIATADDELNMLASRRSIRQPNSTSASTDELSALLGLIKQHDVAGYQQAMQQRCKALSRTRWHHSRAALAKPGRTAALKSSRSTCSLN